YKKYEKPEKIKPAISIAGATNPSHKKSLALRLHFPFGRRQCLNIKRMNITASNFVIDQCVNGLLTLYCALAFKTGIDHPYIKLGTLIGSLNKSIRKVSL